MSTITLIQLSSKFLRMNVITKIVSLHGVHKHILQIFGYAYAMQYMTIVVLYFHWQETTFNSVLLDLIKHL